MDEDQPPRPPDDESDKTPSGYDQGWTAVAYLITGIAFWGGVGWLVDSWLDLDGLGIGIGSVVGAACGVYLIVRKLAP